VDPLPPFVADMRELDGKPIGVMRIFESADAPHIVRGTGAIYLRSSKGKEPIAADDHALVLELARRGREAEAEARERLGSLPVVGHVFNTPDSGVSNEEDRDVRFIARAAPLTVSPALRDWPLTRAAAEWCLEKAGSLLTGYAPYGRQGPDLASYGRAIAAIVKQEKGGQASDVATVLADSGGVVGIELRRGTIRDDTPGFITNAILDGELRPLAVALIETLTAAEAIGRSVVDLWILTPADSRSFGGGHRVPRDLHVAREVTIPADADEVAALAESWHREVQRALGIVKYEGERA
jgi:hypothetical protein